MAEQQRDVFVSYAHENADWVRVLAANLHESGLEVWFDEWEIVGGVRLSQRLQEGLSSSRVVVLVVSAAAGRKEWWQEEFGAAMAGVIGGSQRLVPVLLDDVLLPPFVANRVYVDFRHVDSPHAYSATLDQLVRAVRNVPQANRPARGSGIVVPPSIYRAEGPRLARLRIDKGEVVFSTDAAQARHVPAGIDYGLASAVRELDKARYQATSTLLHSDGHAEGALHASLLKIGHRLGTRFLDGAAGHALAQQVAQAHGRELRLAVEVEDLDLADLPWETLVLPGHEVPLVLQAGIEVYRAVAIADPVAIAVPGPLRMLAVVASPDSGGGELLDYEAELGRILTAVDSTRRTGGAHVRVLNWGSPAAIRAALAEERFHVLHISCHAQPRALVLESESGGAEIIDAAQFVRDILVPDQGVPLVVLAGCSTALGARIPTTNSGSAEGGEGNVGEGERALPGLARDLLHAGVPAVLAMTAPVTDTYATNLAAGLYEELARRRTPVPLIELSAVRRRLEDQRRALPANDPRAVWAEWATPALFQAGPAQPLWRRSDDPDEKVPLRVQSRVQLGGMIRRVGDFVGRRPELRAILRDLRRAMPGVVLHGIGGIGKSSLAVEIIDHLGDDAGLVVPISGTTRVDLIFDAIRLQLLAFGARSGLSEMHPLRQAVTLLIDAATPWEQRLTLLQQVVLSELPILLLLDNAEDLLAPADNATWQLTDDQLAAFLAAWVRLDRTQLVVTSRHPFGLPGRVERRLPHHHLGPLSEAETRKLLWRLPALDQLEPAQRRRAYTDVGGHPRSLEYLDALLAGGDARFDDIAERIETALLDRDIDDVDAWLHGVKGDLDRALAETVTIAADDVLLDALLSRLEHIPHARQLLLGAAVYRQPVDDTGLAWQIADHQPHTPDPGREHRMTETGALLSLAHRENVALAEVGLTDEQVDQWSNDLQELRRPPLAVPSGYRHARDTLLRLGLLSPVVIREHGSAPLYLVHRWTANALATRTDTPRLTEAHRRAARYLQWRVKVWQQDRTGEIRQLVEARHHHHQAGDLADAVHASLVVSQELHTWGAWAWEYDLCRETVGWLPQSDLVGALGGAFIHQLGIIAQELCDYTRAEKHFRAALAIHEEIGDRPGAGDGYHHLGRIAELRGDYNQAEQHNQTALAIRKKVNDPGRIGDSYHQLGMIFQVRGRYGQAEQHYQAALTNSKEVGDHAGAAVSLHQLGALAQLCDNYDLAEKYYQASLAIKKAIGNRIGIANSLHQLGTIARMRNNYDQAEQHHRAALNIFEEVGHRAHIANSMLELGAIAQARGEHEQAQQLYLSGLSIKEQIGDRAGIGDSLYQLGTLAVELRAYNEAARYFQSALAVKREVGDQVTTALLASRIGALLTTQGEVAEGVPYNVLALSIRANMGSAEARIDLKLLDQQRSQLGDGEFRDLLKSQLDTESVRVVLRMLAAGSSSEPSP